MNDQIKANLWSILRLTLNAVAGYLVARPETWSHQLATGILAVTAGWTVIDNKTNPPAKPEAHKPPSITSTLGLLLFGFMLCTGCAINRPFVQETTVLDKGVVTTTKTVRLTTWALWPATQEISKQRGSLGKTLSAGTASADQETTGGTNGVEALRVINDILGKVHP